MADNQNLMVGNVPMIDTDNNAVMVPSEKIQDQLTKGYKRGMFMTDTENNTVVVPHDQLGNALKKNYKVGPAEKTQQTSAAATAQEPDQGMLSGALGRIKDVIKSGIKSTSPLPDRWDLQGVLESPALTFGIPFARGAIGQAKASKEAISQAKEQAQQASTAEPINKILGYGRAGVSALSAADPFATGSVTDINKLITQGKTGEATGVGLTDAALLSLGLLGGKTVGETKPMTSENAINSLRQGVNPTVADAGYVKGAKPGTGFMGEAENHLDKIVNKGHETGLPQKLANAKTPGEALNHTAETVRATAQDDPYYKTRIEPFINENFGTVKGYRGATIGEGNNATLGQMSDRLSTINKTLQPTYIKGGPGSVAAESAIGAEAKASLTAEAEAIRNQIADELSRRTGITADKLKAERKNYGEMNDLADTVQYHANESVRNENIEKNTPLTIGDLINPKGKIGQARLGAVMGRSHPQVQALRDVFERYPAKPNVPPPTGTPQTPVTRQQPAWMNQPVSSRPNAQNILDAIRQRTPETAPAVPATQPGLLRPGAGTAPSSSPLPFGPDPALMRRPVVPTVGQEYPEISPLSLGPKQGQTVGSAAGAAADTGYFQAAKAKLGPKASISDIATEAQKMKDAAASPTRALPSDFRISTDETINGTDLTMKDMKGKKMGTIGIRDSEPIYGRAASEVGDITLSKEHQGKGYGQALYERAAKHAAQSGNNYLVSSGSPTKAAAEAWQRLKAAHPNEIRYVNGRWQWDLSKFK